MRLVHVQWLQMRKVAKRMPMHGKWPPSVIMPSDWSPFNDPLPFDRVLILGFVTQPPTSYHGNPEEPMVLCVRGVLTVAIDAAEPHHGRWCG